MKKNTEYNENSAGIMHFIASGISHDFNNILTVMEMNVHCLLQHFSNHSQMQSHSPERECLGEIKHAITQAKMVSSGMMSLGLDESVIVEPFVLEGTLEEFLQVVRRLLPDRIHLQANLAADLVVMSNPGFLYSALLNLVLNARDAMGSGGQLDFCVRPAPEWSGDAGPFGESMQIGEWHHVRYAEVLVQDSGHGMTQETLRQLFRPFFTTKARRSGYGLGLFMVRQFVERTGAVLTVESRWGQGTAFRLFLPLHWEQCAQHEHTLPAVPNALSVPGHAVGAGVPYRPVAPASPGAGVLHFRHE
jgi:signal transduction histidine kinase